MPKFVFRLPQTNSVAMGMEPTTTWQEMMRDDRSGALNGRSIRIGTERLRCASCADLVYALRIDTDPSAATNFLIFDPINDANPTNGYWDHAIGDQFTGNGGGTVAGDLTLYNALIATKPVAQNSWRMDFFPITFDPNTSGNYTIELAAFAKGSTAQSPIAATSIQVIVENGAVPEPFSILVWSSLIVGAMVSSRRIH